MMWPLSNVVLLLLSATPILLLEALPEAAFGEQSFIREPSNQIAIRGEHVTLPCRVVNKKGELQWTRDGFGLGVERNLTGFSRYHMIGSDEEDDWTLDINPVELEDDAEFQCQVGAAENAPPIRSRFAVLTILVPPSRPFISPARDSLRTVEGKTVQISCESLGGKPAADITWFDSRNEVVREGVLTVKELAKDGKRFNTKSTLNFTANAEHHHLKNFTCQAQNSADRQPHSVSINIQVHYPPKVTLDLGTSLIKEGKSAEFTCDAHANPSQMTYDWYISGKLIPEAKNRVYAVHSVDRRLHNAIIRCDATNSIGKSVQAAKLNVSYPPLFLTRPENNAGSPGESVQLSCRVDSNPKALYQWYHKSFLVGHSENITIKVDERQTGEYICKALVPGYDDITASAMIYMKQPPIVRNNNRIESGAEGETGSFSCSALSVPHAMSVSWSFNGADINVDSGQYAIQENLSSNEVESTLIIKKIYPEDFGSYTCTVRNELGIASTIMHLRKRSPLPLLVIMAAVIGGVILTIAVIMIVVLCRRSSSSSNKKLNNLLTIHRTVIKGGGNNNNNSSTSADEISNNSSEMNKVEVRTSSSLSHGEEEEEEEECWAERSDDSYKNHPPLSVSPHEGKNHISEGNSYNTTTQRIILQKPMDVVDSVHPAYRDNYASNIAHLNGGYSTSSNHASSSSPLMKSSDSIFASSSSNHPGGSYYANAKYPPGYHHSFDYVVPPAQQSTPRSNGSSSVGSNNLNSNLDNYCVYVNSTALLQPGLSAQNVGKVSSLATHV